MFFTTSSERETQLYLNEKTSNTGDQIYKILKRPVLLKQNLIGSGFLRYSTWKRVFRGFLA